MKYLIGKYKEKNHLLTALIVVSITYLISFGFMYFKKEQRISELLDGMYAIDKETGVVVKLEKAEYTNEDRISEYKDHVRLFIRSFYQFDQYTFLDNIEEAKNYICTESYEIEIDKYRKEKILERISESDLILTVKINDLKIKLVGDTYKGSFSFTQSYRAKNNVRQRIIEGEFDVFDTDGRTDDNSHAATICNYIITRKEKI